MNSICEFLYDILPTTSAKVQAWASVLTAGVALVALSSWKKQKQYEIYVEVSSAIPKIFPKVFSVIALYTKAVRSEVDDDDNFLKAFIDAQTESIKILAEVNFNEFAARVELLGNDPDYVVLKETYRTVKTQLGNISSAIYEAHSSIRDEEELDNRLKKMKNIQTSIQSATMKLLNASNKFTSQIPKQS